MYYYAFTIRCMSFIRTLPTYETFNSMITHFKTKYTWTDVRHHLEIVEKKNGNHNVHIHGMISTPRKLSRRMMESVLKDGYVLTNFGFVNSKGAWTCYITKSEGEVQHLEYLLSAGTGPDEVREDEDNLLSDTPPSHEELQLMRRLKTKRLV